MAVPDYFSDVMGQDHADGILDGDGFHHSRAYLTWFAQRQPSARPAGRIFLTS